MGKLIAQLIKFWHISRRLGGFRALLQMARNAPSYFKLLVRLLRDPRVPPLPKAVLIGCTGFAISPLNIPNWIPIIGPLDDIAIALLAINFFAKHLPAEVLAEHKAAVGLA